MTLTATTRRYRATDITSGSPARHNGLSPDTSARYLRAAINGYGSP